MNKKQRELIIKAFAIIFILAMIFSSFASALFLL